MPVRLLAVLAIACLYGVPRGQAQLAELGGFAGPSQIRNGDLGRIGFAQQDLLLESGPKFGARLGLNSGILTGHELTYSVERGDLSVAGSQEGRASIQRFHYNYVVHLTPKVVRVRPFFTAGAGYANFAAPADGIFESASGTNKLTVNYGGGVKLKLSPMFGLRFDVRDHVSGKPNYLDLPDVKGRLHAIEYSAGFSLLF